MISYILVTLLAFVLYRLVQRCFHRRAPASAPTTGQEVVLITGCDSGFGEGLAVQCVRKGFIVFAAVLNEASVEALRAKCASSEGGEELLHPFIMDVADATSVAAGLDFVSSRLHPGQGIHALVNNAGIARVGFDEWLRADDYDAAWRINTLGPIRVTHAFRHLVKGVRGRLIYMISTSGRIAVAAFGPYSVSKFGLEAYADTVRRELKPYGVRVSILEPGFHKTPITTGLAACFRAAWERAPDEVKKTYGEQFIHKLNAMFDRLLNSPLATQTITDVVDAYMDAITSDSPKKRYVVGLDAKLSFAPLSCMPAGLQDGCLAMIDKLVGAPSMPTGTSEEEEAGSCEGMKREK